MRIILLLFLVSLKIIVDLAIGVVVAIILIVETSNICLLIPPYWKTKLIPIGSFLVASVFYESTLIRRSISIIL